MKSSYILVDAEIAPDVFVKVVDAKSRLSSGKCKTTNEALTQAKISRSAFYKYKNHVFAYNEIKNESMVTLSFTLDDVAGILSDMLIVIASYGANVMTINQSVPINGIANVNITLRTNDMTADIHVLLTDLLKIDGVNKADILAMS